MNHREDLEFQLQKVTLAIQEVIKDVYITDKESGESLIGATVYINELNSGIKW